MHNESTYPYTIKQAKTSIHHFIRNIAFESGASILDVGGGRGDAVAKALALRGAKMTCIDAVAQTDDSLIYQIPMDLNKEWSQQWTPARQAENFNIVLALDILEHLLSPETACQEIHRRLRPDGLLYASTGNIAYLPMRLLLLFGVFNYTNRGILDRTHLRLFTLATFKKLFNQADFKVEKAIGFGPPLADLCPQSKLLALLDWFCNRLARLWPSLFAFQFLLICRRSNSSTSEA